jgi:RNA polymerase sigma factor (TIGR02999 family)
LFQDLSKRVLISDINLPKLGWDVIERRPLCAPGVTLKDQNEITILLNRIRQGDEAAEAQAFAQIYDDLRKAAHRMMRYESSGHTLQPTALVNEAYIRLVRQADADFQNRKHFFAIAARVMRRVLVDNARARMADKRWGGQLAVDSKTDEIESPAASSNLELVELDQAITELAKTDSRAAQVLEMRVFGGFELQEIADLLQTSLATVKRDLVFSRAWLSSQGYS